MISFIKANDLILKVPINLMTKLVSAKFIGVGRFRIVGGGPRFRKLGGGGGGGGGGGQIPSRHMTS